MRLMYNPRAIDGVWQVDVFDMTGESIESVVVFQGQYSESMAREYAAWKNDQLPRLILLESARRQSLHYRRPADLMTVEEAIKLEWMQ